MDVKPQSADIISTDQHLQRLQNQHQHHHQQHQQQQQQNSKQSQQHQIYQPNQQQRQHNKKHHTRPQLSKEASCSASLPTTANPLDVQVQSSMAYQHKHALHRLRRLKKRSPHRDLVISFVPRLRISIIDRLDFFNRYSKQEQEVLSCFDFLDELILTYCDGGLESPRYSQKFYQFMIKELI